MTEDEQQAPSDGGDGDDNRPKPEFEGQTALAGDGESEDGFTDNEK